MFVFFSSRRRHPRFDCDWSSDVCSSDLTFRSSPIPLPSDETHRRRSLRSHAWREPRGAPPEGLGGDCRGARIVQPPLVQDRSEERRVGEKSRTRWAAVHLKKKKPSST